MNRPPGQPVETPRALAGQFLVFIGPLISIGGMLAMLRTHAFDWFFAAMIPVGVAVWWLGARLKREV